MRDFDRQTGPPPPLLKYLLVKNGLSAKKLYLLLLTLFRFYFTPYISSTQTLKMRGLNVSTETLC